MRWAVDRKYSAGFGLALVLLVTIGGLSYTSILRSRSTTRQTRQTQEALKQLGNTLSDIKDAEIGQRGYLLTGNEHYLKPYETTILKIDSDVVELERIAINDPLQRQEIAELSRLLPQKKTELEAIVHLYRTEGFEAALRMVKTNRGNDLMARIRQVFSQLSGQERLLLEENIRNEDLADDQTTFFIIGGVLLEALVLSAIFLKLNQLYQSAQAQVQELEQLNQLKDDFLSTVSHELRTPMSSIKMATHMLEVSLKRLDLLKDDTSVINRYVKILREEGEREIALINDLLDLARIDAATEPLTLTTIALQVYIPHVIDPFIERTRQHQQHLVVQIPDALPACTTDLSYLERILTELLHNACKYTPDGETITVSAQAIGEALELCVSNSGVEIPTVECDRIFDKFYRIPNSDPWKHGGTGLGLALVKKLTTHLGGTIHAKSGNGQTTLILGLRGCLKRFERLEPLI